jgi:hypothetical protein
LFQLSQHAAEWEERMKSAAVRREQHLHATTTIADSQTVGMRSVATAATTVDDVMTRNFHVVLHEFEEETRRLRQIDDRLQQLRAAPETDLPVPSKAQLEALLASGFREEDEQLFCDEGWTDLNSEAEDADDNKSDSLNDGS